MSFVGYRIAIGSWGDSHYSPVGENLKSLRDSAFGTTENVAGVQLPCAFKQPCASCNNVGVTVVAEQGQAVAKVCECVRNCPGCFGQARRIEGSTAVSCKNPSPNIVKNLFNAARIPGHYADAELDRFQNKSGNGMEVVGKLKQWRDQFSTFESKGLVLSGPVGVGKTYILAALAKDFVMRGFSVQFTDFFQLLGELRAGFSEGKADSSILAPLINVDILIIDELGKSRNRDFDKTVIDQLVCGRYNQNKTIIASTNYQLSSCSVRKSYNIPLDRESPNASEFESDSFGPLEGRIGNRVFSRLYEMTHFIELTGDDYRPHLSEW